MPHTASDTKQCPMFFGKQAKLTQCGFAAHLGIPQSRVYKCEVVARRADVAEFADWAEACYIEPLEAMQMLEISPKSRQKRTNESGRVSPQQNSSARVVPCTYSKS